LGGQNALGGSFRGKRCEGGGRVKGKKRRGTWPGEFRVRGPFLRGVQGKGAWDETGKGGEGPLSGRDYLRRKRPSAGKRALGGEAPGG